MDFGDVVAVNLYVNELEDLPTIDALFGEIFPDDPPARTAIRVFPPDESAEGRDAVSLIAVR